MKKIYFIALLAACFVLGALTTSNALMVTATDDRTIRSAYPTESGGIGAWTWLSSGDGEGNYRMYLKFALPAAVFGKIVTSATLHGYYYDDTHNSRDKEHTLYLVSDKQLDGTTNWTEENLTWNNQPVLLASTGAKWTPTGSLDTNANYGWQSWNITSVVNQEYLGDGIISILMKPTTEEQWTGEQFYSKEYKDLPDIPLGSRGFYLDITLGDAPNPVPIPGAILLFAPGFVGLAAIRRRFRK
jgi:hypothetical protein